MKSQHERQTEAKASQGGSNRDALSSCLRDARLSSVLGRTLGEMDEGLKKWPSYKGSLQAKRFPFPVMGSQGTGKSSLINALCFGKTVLPVDTIETTSVPVEIVYNTRPSSEASVHCPGQDILYVPATADGLREFVHQAANPGNRKGVEKVVIESSWEALSTGAVIIDLPGLGSPDSANHERALACIEQSLGALYILPAIPQLTRMEATRLMPVWMGLPIQFAMNRWDSNRDDEIGESLEATRILLRERADRLGIAKGKGEIPIHVVNVRRALDSTRNGDQEGKLESGIIGLGRHLKTVFMEWGTFLRKGISERVAADLLRAKQALLNRIQDLSIETSQAVANLEKERKKRLEKLKAISLEEDRVRKILMAWQNDALDGLQKWEHDEGAQIRNKIRTLGSKGVTDGPLLDKALEDELGEAMGNACERVRDSQADLRVGLEPALGNLEGLDPTLRNVTGIRRATSVKWEQYASTTLTTIAAVGAFLAGFTFGMSLLVSAGALALGALTKKIVVTTRKSSMEAEVFPFIAKTLLRQGESLRREVADYAERILRTIQEWVVNRRTQAEWEFEDRAKNLRENETRRGQLLDEYKGDLTLLEDSLRSLGQGVEA